MIFVSIYCFILIGKYFHLKMFIFLVKTYYLPYLLFEKVVMVCHFTDFVRYYFLKNTYFLFTHCSLITEVNVYVVTLLSQIHPGCHNNANGINPRSNLKMTDKHAADC